ncbi:hypothetical protein L227DRAFT_598789 [Lentinus tigrinus ALCF2SS1-6]|uniref:Uncharacterized protein n=1 Tax=Lentinus tigrinus ALCF2SS1-6 TaxID=1328759 RepID=A0A5C2SJ51_9APHY|nr:hypothetical protein L227DRAFT_598789 [Lentinus tigrinus ALCF2SS1-6]
MPSFDAAHTAAAARFNETVTETTALTPSAIVVLVVLLLLTITTIGTVVYFVLRSRRRASQIDHQAADAEAQYETDPYFDVVDKSASHWTRLSSWMSCPSSREQEPELPWPIYCVLPHLRPKAPLYVRVLKAIMFWRQEEVKREPFTVADVQRAKEELDARTQAVFGAHTVREEVHGEHWWSHIQVPEIVIHPCDDAPLKYAEFAYAPAASPSKPINVASKLSLASTESEVDSSLPLTPSIESAAVPPLQSVGAVDTLQVPMPSSTAPKEAEGEDDAVNMSSSTGKTFVLRAPPKKKTSSTVVHTTTPSDVAASTPVAASPATASEPTSPTPLTSIPESSAFPVAAEITAASSLSPIAVDVDPSWSPASTASEPDSPMPLTPILESQAFPIALIRAPADVFELSTPPSTFLMDLEDTGEDKDIRNSVSEARRWTGPDSPLRVGLGLSFEEVRQREEEEPQFVIGELSPANSDDSIFEDSIMDEAPRDLQASTSISSSSSSRSAGSVPDILRVLDEVTKEPPTLSGNSLRASTSDSSSVPGPSRTPFAGILDVLKRHIPTAEPEVSSIGTSSSQSTYYGIFGEYRNEGNEDEEDNVDGHHHKDNSRNAFVASWRHRLL